MLTGDAPRQEAPAKFKLIGEYLELTRLVQSAGGSFHQHDDKARVHFDCENEIEGPGVKA
jgi:hypothetical protein